MWSELPATIWHSIFKSHFIICWIETISKRMIKNFDNFYEAYTPKNFPISFFRRFLFVNLHHQRKNYQANSSSLWTWSYVKRGLVDFNEMTIWHASITRTSMTKQTCAQTHIMHCISYVMIYVYQNLNKFSKMVLADFAAIGTATNSEFSCLFLAILFYIM